MNQDRITTTTNFFRLNFEFHEPYELLLDGNFLKLIVERGQPFVHKLEIILNGKVFAHVTECIIRELQLLGDRFKFVLAQAQKHQLIKCRHLIGTNPKMCIEDLVGSTNPKKYMVCSQDIELRRNLRDLPNLPIFYFGPDQRITMEEVNKRNKQLVEQNIKKRLLPNQHELKPIEEYKQQKQKQQEQEKKRKILMNLSAQGIKQKKIAKGPNPLSIKKKAKDENKEGEKRGERKKRIRKRNKKNSGAVDRGFEQTLEK